ncbi:MAG: putative endopeptidase [Pseudonocardiales bacterium]|nr:putative endopeptidase [Pseudonocardiales bacterium]MDT7669492.1 putative endopeptidase [Pseudonocardiales bacterium]
MLGNRSGRLTTCAVLVAATATVAACASPASPGSGPTAPVSGLDLPGYDQAVRPQDDMYSFANGTWLRNTQIPPDLSEYGSFSMLSQRAEEDQRTLIEGAESSNGAPDGSNQRKIGDLYASFMDTARLDQLKATPLAPYFAAVDQLNTPTDLIRHLGDIERFNASDPISIGVTQDAKDATHYVTEASQGDLGMPDRDYYLSPDPKMAAIRDKYRAYVAKMLTLAGQPDADATAGRVLALETKLARAQWTNVQNRDAVASYNKFTVTSATRSTGLDWADYLAAAGMTQPDLVISQPSYFSTLSGLLTSVPLDTWKQYLRWNLIRDHAPYLSQDFVDARFDFVGRTLGGRQQNRERWRRGITAVNTAMGEALGQLYVGKYFTPAAKQRADTLVQNILGAYRTSIDNLDWMSPPTKVAAKDKLAKLAVKIGYPDKWKDYGSLRVDRADLIGNLDRAARLAYQRDLDKLGKPVDRGEWFMTPQTVNAYYNPSMNEIVFPAAILQPPFFNANADDAVNYGGIGGVIGHEISHGFDDQGRHYDGDGNLREWMAPADIAAFTAKTQALVAQYNGYAPLPGTHINGALTLGENIADLSGLTVANRAYVASLGGKQPPVLDGFTGAQRFFLGYAQIWRSKERDESLRDSLLTDPHSPGQFRTNGVLPNVDAFYQAFNVHVGDSLFRTPQDRIHIW